MLYYYTIFDVFIQPVTKVKRGQSPGKISWV